MAYNTGSAIWNGGLKDGKGTISSQSGSLSGPYTYSTRFEDDRTGTNPEEIIGAALAACFSMFLSGVLEKAGTPAKHIKTDAKVHLGKDESGPLITKIDLTTEAEVPDIKDADFQEHVRKSKENCPISRALRAVPEITVQASLRS